MGKNKGCTTAKSSRSRLPIGLAAVLLVGALGATAFAMADGAGQAKESEAQAGTENLLAYHQQLGIDLEATATDAQAALTDGSTLADKSAATLGTREFCLSCHDWDSIVDSTELSGDVTVYNKQGVYNVHDNHNGLVDCSDCHKVDGTASTLGCVSCHYMELPEGWVGFY